MHTFQASLEAVLAQLCDAEQAQKSLTTNANSDSDPTAFRNQLKVLTFYLIIDILTTGFYFHRLLAEVCHLYNALLKISTTRRLILQQIMSRCHDKSC